MNKATGDLVLLAVPYEIIGDNLSFRLGHVKLDGKMLLSDIEGKVESIH